MKPSPVMQTIFERLERTAKGANRLTLDEVGEAIGTEAVSADEIDALLAALEERGITIEGRMHESGAALLAAVLRSARELRAQLGRTPTRAEVAEATGFALESVHHALALARVMQR